MKKKNVFTKILAFCMILCFSLISTGCIGLLFDEGGSDFSDDDFADSMAVEMYGTKVLYRPDDYDYNIGSGGSAEIENDYYGQYAYYIMRDLFLIYGWTNIDNTTIRLPNFNSENRYYLYDSIRYQVDTVGIVTRSQKVTADGQHVGEVEPVEDTGIDTYYIVGADPSISWNWTLNANPSLNNLKAFVYSESSSDGYNIVEQNNHIYINNNLEPSTALNTYYTTGSLFSSSAYEDIYLSDSESGSPWTDYENYSDYVKALEYAIYCYAVDLEPAQVTVQIFEDGTYNVQIGSFASVDEALEDAKDTFRKLGAYVGLVDRQITKIQNWILENVIGATALNADDTFTNYYNGVTEYVLVDENGDYIYDGDNVIIVGYDFTSATSSTFTLGRDYETAVANIMEGVCQYVPIGSDGVTIDQRFLASNVMEYAGNMFMIADDGNFPAPGTELGLTGLRPLEYQSVVLMLNEEMYLDGLTIALKYDADLDGTEEGVYDFNKYLDIIVDINYYNLQTNTREVLASEQVRVYDGPYDENYLSEGAGDNVGDGVIAPVDHTSALMLDDLGQVHVGTFNVDVGNGLLKTDVGNIGNYTIAPFVSTEALVLTGTTDVRRYYEVVEYGTNPEYDTDELENGKTYISGRLNPNMFSGSDGCDYIEITYKVIKNAGDKDTNYKFYTGIAFVDYSSNPY